MSSQQPTWEERIEKLRTRYTQLQGKIGMEDVTRKLGDTATEIAGLPGEIEQIRARGYAFAGYLERKVEVLAEQWGEVRQQVNRAATEEIARVQEQFEAIGTLWKKLEARWSGQGREIVAEQIERAIGELETAADSARKRVEGMYGQVPQNVQQTKSQLAQIKRYLALVDESTASWNPTECIVLAVEAEWVASGKGKEDPAGVLYLTDQRLIFEQKEKVGGRFGFGGEKVQSVLWDAPVGAISEAVAEDKGLFGRKDLVHLKLSAGDYADLTVEVKSGVDSKWYVQQLNRVITGEIERERAIPVDETLAEKVSAAPTACTTCGAVLPPLARGMTEIACEYCGTVIRI